MEKYIFRMHAVRQMQKRAISVKDVKQIIKEGETIKEYSDDLPYPSRLINGQIEARPIHVIVAENSEENTCIIITAYEPDPALWSDGFSKRTDS